MSIARSSVVQSSIAFQYYLQSSRMGSYVQLTQFECIFNRQHLQARERQPTAELIAFMRCKKAMLRGRYANFVCGESRNIFIRTVGCSIHETKQEKFATR